MLVPYCIDSVYFSDIWQRVFGELKLICQIRQRFALSNTCISKHTGTAVADKLTEQLQLPSHPPQHY